ncbi:hypothetical protein ACFX19_016636 [Malus domestica]
MQTSHNKASRTFMDYDSISQAMDGICGLYERKLRELNPVIRDISYDIGDLYNFIDGLADMSALVILYHLNFKAEEIPKSTSERVKVVVLMKTSVSSSSAILGFAEERADSQSDQSGLGLAGIKVSTFTHSFGKQI